MSSSSSSKSKRRSSLGLTKKYRQKSRPKETTMRGNFKRGNTWRNRKRHTRLRRQRRLLKA